MAVLNNQELASLRRRYQREFGESSIDFTKATINAAYQVIEDWYTNSKATVSGDIDTATSPKTFTNEEKKFIFRAWLLKQAKVEVA